MNRKSENACSDTRLILSRKGFDSKNGGIASPVLPLPDGAMLSLPIPSKEQSNYGSSFADIKYDGIPYLEIIKSLNPNFDKRKCHLDPDIREGAISPKNWKAAFGQCGGSQTHLQNNGVGVGDLFLFFGWFKKTKKLGGGKLKFDGDDIHAIYGYLQIGEIVEVNDDVRKKYSWHPHTSESFKEEKNNFLYLPSEHLTINGKKLGRKGYGVFKFDKSLVLTKERASRSKWKLDWMKNAEITYHSEKSIRDGYFQSTPIGQEFVVKNCPEAIQWAIDLILENSAE